MTPLQQNLENSVKQFIKDTLELNELPKGSLQDILKDGTLLCDLISRFSPGECINKNEGRTKFAYQDNIGQFLRVAENHIPQSDLFQTVDLLEGKRMQSVISCLLAIKRTMCEKRIKPVKKMNLTTVAGRKSAHTYPLSTTVISPYISNRIPLETAVEDWKLKFNTSHKRQLPPTPNKEGYVKSRVQMISTNHLLIESTPKSRRFSSASSESNQPASQPNSTRTKPLLSTIMPTPSKSTPLITAPDKNMDIQKKKSDSDLENNQKQQIKYYQSIEQANRKTSLKKMGACAITVYNEDGSTDVYAMGKSIGKGQFGEVFGGLNMDTGEYVAIKRIKINQMDCDDMNEVGVLQHLDSEYIVRYKGFSKDKEHLHIILEYVEMGSLLNNIKAFGKFPEKLAASYTFKILSGLHYLHSKDVVHCDLKAANILTTKTGGLKLTDFGVSLSLKMKEDESTGEPAGTPNWMAPEVIKFAGATDKADIWSLGCTIVEMLTGKPPYAGVPSFTALYRIVEDEEPPIPKKIKLSEEATEFLLACFKKNPEDRPSAYELMQFRWMAPYFKKSPLRPPEHSLKKSKSETCIEMKNEPSIKSRHVFVDYRTIKTGEKCYGCSHRMKDLWVKQCQDCHLKFHPHCINKAPRCTKHKHVDKYLTTKEKVKYTPLAPLRDDFIDKTARKFYILQPKSENNNNFVTEKYSKYDRRNTSYIMT